MKIKFLSGLLLLVSGVAVLHAQSPASVESALIRKLAEVGKYGTYGETSDDKKLAAANKELTAILIRNGDRLAILKYAFPKLKDEMYVATSKDGRLRIYSWDTGTGGTMHDYANVFQYQGKSGRVYSWTDPETEDASGGPFYTEIFEVATRTGPIYLANSTFIASTSMHGQSLNALRIDGEKLDQAAKLIKTRRGVTNEVGITYDFFSVVDRPERPVKLFFFNAAKKEFRFPIVIEDDKTFLGRVTDKFITYRFNGKYFVKVS